MKKSLLFIALLFLLSGCGQRPDHPYEINYRGKTLSYYDTEDTIDIGDFDVLENRGLKDAWASANTILVNEEGVIRCITITDSAAITYKSISVGDDASKIDKSFGNESVLEHKEGDYDYVVVFNSDDIEEDPTDQNKEDSWINIHYYVRDYKIYAIQICDVQYSTKLH